jgi:hypothetical protein
VQADVLTCRQIQIPYWFAFSPRASMAEPYMVACSIEVSQDEVVYPYGSLLLVIEPYLCEEPCCVGVWPPPPPVLTIVARTCRISVDDAEPQPLEGLQLCQALHHYAAIDSGQYVATQFQRLVPQQRLSSRLYFPRKVPPLQRLFHWRKVRLVSEGRIRAKVRVDSERARVELP